jgi:predicted anti-sigma-YlaC factor YlaD
MGVYHYHEPCQGPTELLRRGTTPGQRVKRPLLAIAAALGWLSLAACSPRAIALKAVADAISSNREASSFARDDDPELVRGAVPFALKSMESLLEVQPRHEGLLTQLAAGFAQYAYAFVVADADRAEWAGRGPEARALRVRARKLLVRAREYGLRGLEVRHPGIAASLRGARDLGPALAPLNKEDLPLVYWTAASWALAIASDKEDMQLVSELPVPGALMRRALELDEAWNEGAVHEFFVSWEPAQDPGPQGRERARAHLVRALELGKDRKLGPLVAYAEAVCVPAQDRATFTRLLSHVLAEDAESDPAHRLENVLAQQRARLLLDHADDLFA